MKIKKYLIQWIGENKTDRLGLLLGYLGCLLMTWGGIWSYANFNIPFSELSSFVVSFGGLL